MATAPNPDTIAADLVARVRVILLSGGHIRQEADAEWTRLFDETDKLQKASVIYASAIKADLYQLRGDVSSMEYWANNAIKNGDRLVGASVLASGYANLGFASKAFEWFGQLLDIRDGKINLVLVNGLSCGAFALIRDAAARLIKAGGTVERKDVCMIASEATAALDALAVPETCVRQMMDEAGAILRRRQLMWLQEAPDIHVPSAGEAPFFALNYRVDVSPTEAAEMTWELAEQLARRELMPFGVTVSFVGQRAEPAAAK